MRSINYFFYLAITLYELHATLVQLAKKLFDGREINGSHYLVRTIRFFKYITNM